ncbi:hypothetical protein F5Y18DRAFT_429174 [Xylariaceae sp. FL1019]|nr:hypothetical protein F5Y18DRAFT_429174 [Xylariaceae sp. FL1019]
MPIFHNSQPTWASPSKALIRHVRERVIRTISSLETEFPKHSFWQTQRYHQRGKAFRRCAVVVLTEALEDVIFESKGESRVRGCVERVLANLHVKRDKESRAHLPIWGRHPELLAKDLNENTIDAIREFNQSSKETRWKADIPLQERVTVLQETLMRGLSGRVKRMFEDGRIQTALVAVLTIDGMMRTRTNLKKILGGLMPPDESIWWVTNEFWGYMGCILERLFEECERLSMSDSLRDYS